jgi:hypothetical protein
MKQQNGGDRVVYVKLLSNKNGIVRYAYQPECNGKRSVARDEGIGELGILAYNIENDTMAIEKMAEDDSEYGFHRPHVLSMIRKNINNLPVEKTLVWY